MTPAPLTISLLLIFFTGASFFFALAESSLFSLGAWRVRHLLERHPVGGRRIAALLENPDDLLATIVLGNTVANAAIVIVCLTTAMNGRWPWWVAVPVALALILIGGEVVPKTLAVRSPEHWSLQVSRPMGWLQRLTRPVQRSARKLTEALLHALVPAALQPLPGMPDDEYRELVELAFQQGTLAQGEKEALLQIISLDKKTASDVMRPRAQMACISDELSVEEMVEAARRHKHRRLPIYDGNPDTIVGVLNTKALLLDPQIDLSEAIEFPSFVPSTMNLLQLFQSLRRQQRGLAIVLDEFGGTAGIVTMEDILAEVIGELRPERRMERVQMERLADGKWRLSGAVRIDDFSREHPALGFVEEVETMGGLLVHLLEAVPAIGQTAPFRGLLLTADQVDDRRVKRLVVEVARRKPGA